MLIRLARSLRPATARDHRCDRGASAVEYGLLVAAIAAVIVAVVFGLGTLVRNALSDTGDCISSNGTSTNCPTNT
jgi:pilus assembly protein Flp/PilA